MSRYNHEAFPIPRLVGAEEVGQPNQEESAANPCTKRDAGDEAVAELVESMRRLSQD